MTRTSFSVATGTVKRPPIETVSRVEKSDCRNAPTNEVGDLPTLTGLTDDELEAHIRSCGELVEIHISRWRMTADPDEYKEARRWSSLMAQAILGRSPAQVKRMEKAKGLR